jgi:hypothetical protein
MALIFEENFESVAAIEANGANAHNLVAGDIVAGYSGNGVQITGTKYLNYLTTGRFNWDRGTIEMMVKPAWGGRDNLGVAIANFFLNIEWSANQRCRLYYDANLGIFYTYPQVSPAIITSTTVPLKWVANEWHKVIFYWDFTLSETQSYMIFKVDAPTASQPFRGYSEIVLRAPVTADALAGGSLLWIGSRSTVSDKFNGVIDSVKIYDESLLPAGDGGYVRDGVPFPNKVFNPQDGGATETAFRAIYPADGVCSPWETNATQPTDCPLLGAGVEPASNVIFFKRPHLESVYEGFVPAQGDIDGPYTYKGTAGEIETLFFNVYSRIALTNVVVTKTALTGPGTIPTSAMDLRIVKNWFQAGHDGGYGRQNNPSWVAELLLHDDTIALETDATLGTFKVPTLPVQDHVDTDIAAATSRQFALMVTVPPDAPAGNYTTTIRLTADGGVDVTKVLTLTVLSFALRASDKNRAIMLWHNNDTPYAQPSQQNLDIWDIIAKDFESLKSIGINFPCLCCPNNMSASNPPYGDAAWRGTSPTYALDAAWEATSICTPQIGTETFLEIMQNKIEVAKAAGITKMSIYAGVVPANLNLEYCAELVTLLNNAGIEVWLWGKDEFGHSWPSLLAEQITKAKRVHAIGGKCYGCPETVTAQDTYIANLPTYNAQEPVGNADIEASVWNISQAATINAMAARVPTDTEAPDRLEGFYFQIRDGNTFWHRHNMGFIPWLTGLLINPSQFKAEPPRAYNDFTGTINRAYGYVSPSIDGTGVYRNVPTFNLIAAREGWKDERYLQTWKYYRDRAAVAHPSDVAASDTVIADLLDKYRVIWAMPLEASTWDADRETIITEIGKMMALNPSQHRSVISGVITAMWKRFRKIGGVRQ